MDSSQAKSTLESLKSELESRISRTHKHIFQKDEPVSANFNEQIKQTENDSLVATLEAEGLEELSLIDQALQRITDGNYGDCTKCGKQIDSARLEAIPYAAHCIECAD